MNGELKHALRSEGTDDLDLLLTRHFQEDLDPQLGKAAAHFESMVTKQSLPMRRRLWIGASATALAASVVIGLMLYSLMRPVKPVADTPVAVEVEQGLLELERTVAWKTFDEGTVLMEDQTPMRRVRREVLETVQYYDPERQAVVEMTVPKEEVYLVKLAMY